MFQQVVAVMMMMLVFIFLFTEPVKQLVILADYQALEFIIDDSGCMQCATDSINLLTHQPMSRWKGASLCLKEMIEILAYLLFNTIFV